MEERVPWPSPATGNSHLSHRGELLAMAGHLSQRLSQTLHPLHVLRVSAEQGQRSQHKLSDLGTEGERAGRER